MSTPVPSKPSEVKDWCIRQGFHPSRLLGQNFLVDGNAIDFIVSAAGAKDGARLLEIGPGMGALTHPMLARGATVTAIEKDRRLAELLKASCPVGANFELIVGDALEISLDALLMRGFDALVSNLPYSVGTRILLDVCRHPQAPKRLVVMVQREVAERLAARPGSPARGQAGVWVQARWRVKTMRQVPPSCFWPQPEVSSTVLELELDDRLPVEIADTFYRLVKVAFTQRRKQLSTILRNNAATLGLAPETAQELGGQARPETLSHEDWLRLAASVHGAANVHGATPCTSTLGAENKRGVAPRTVESAQVEVRGYAPRPAEVVS